MNLLERLQDIVTRTEDGMLLELDAAIELRELKQTAELVLGSIKAFETEHAEEIANQGAEYPDGYKGYKVAMVAGRKTYDYSNVEEVVKMKKDLKFVEDRYKSMLESYIKGNTNSNVTTDGEVLEMPKIKYGKGYLKLTPVKK